jgi:toxin ParE1/3/4
VKRCIVRSGLAEVDLLEHLDYIADDNPDAALRFIEAVEKAFKRLAEMPEIGSVREFDNPRLSDVRMWPVPKFSRYLIFYQVTEDSMKVLRVLHSARDIPALFDQQF